MATFQLSAACRNAGLDAYEATVGASAVLKIYSGSMPANCAAARTGTVLATLPLPSNWMADAASGAKALLGTWQDASADATGTAGYFSIFDNGVTTCHMQGDVTATGGGGAMTIDNTSIASGQQVNVTAFGLTAANS